METVLPKFGIGDSGLAKRNNAILVAINYKDANLERFEKSLKYVTNPKATNQYLQHYSGLSKSDPVEHLKSIAERFHKPIDTRLFKHFVFSYGNYWLEEKAMMEFTQNIMDHLSDTRGYPYMFALHTNTKHPHSHALFCCTSPWDGHQFSQSPSGLEELKDYYDEQAQEKGFPLLLRRKKAKGKVLKIDGSAITAKDGNVNTDFGCVYYIPVTADGRTSVNQYQPGNTAVSQRDCYHPAGTDGYGVYTVQDFPVSQLWDDYRNDCREMFLTGLEIGMNSNFRRKKR